MYIVKQTQKTFQTKLSVSLHFIKSTSTVIPSRNWATEEPGNAKPVSELFDKIKAHSYFLGAHSTGKEMGFIVLPFRIAHFTEQIPRSGKTPNGIIVFHSSSGKRERTAPGKRPLPSGSFSCSLWW